MEKIRKQNKLWKAVFCLFVAAVAFCSAAMNLFSENVVVCAKNISENDMVVCAKNISENDTVVCAKEISENHMVVCAKNISENHTVVCAKEIMLEDGEYSIEVTLEGGSGRASIESPTTLYIENKQAYAIITWSSSNYDYMIVSDEKYFPINEEGNSVFKIPVTQLDKEMEVVADTIAMSTPHEIEYTLTFISETVKKSGENSVVKKKGWIVIAILLVVVVAVLFIVSHKKSRQKNDKAKPNGEASVDKAKPNGEASVDKAKPNGEASVDKAKTNGEASVDKAKTNDRKTLHVWIGLLLCAACLSGCGRKVSKETSFVLPDTIGQELSLQYEMELQYATEFKVGYYSANNAYAGLDNIPADNSGNISADNSGNIPTDNSGNGVEGEMFRLIAIRNENPLLIVPEGYDMEQLPKDIPENITVCKTPKHIYLAASQVMAMMVAIDSISNIQFSGIKQEDWYETIATQKMQSGDILYAGKYSAPDYELMMDKGCDFAIENTMIYHTPEVREKIVSFGIPVLVDRSSYEMEPLGRTEWVKLYGALMKKEQLAKEVFDEQEQEYLSIKDSNSNTKLDTTGHTTKDTEADEAFYDIFPTVAFFYISANGEVKVRKSTDYLPKMIAMAGGAYIFSNLGEEDENAMSTVTLQMEEFYSVAKDADFLIYNSTIEGELVDLDDLIVKSALLKDFKAVQNNQVYCTTSNLFQATMQTGTIIKDIHEMLAGGQDMEYLYQLK